MNIWIWLAFLGLILIFLYLDLAVFHKTPHKVSNKEALYLSLLWIFISLIFNVLIYFIYENNWFEIGISIGNDLSGKDAALKYFTGYIIEKSLSLDNIFVIAMIFAYFKIPAMYQHRILFWGILGALFFRAVMIIAGIALLTRYGWITYVFGGMLLYSSIRMLIVRHDQIDPYKNPVIRMLQKIVKISNEPSDGKFFTRVKGKRAITNLFLVLIIIETTDIFFAVDSIPAIFAVTTDPFIVFTSNVFAILGLRSLYFLLAGMMDRFRYVKMSLVFILAFVGVKMLLVHHYKFPTPVSLTIILGMLAVGIVASLMAGKKDKARLSPPEIT